MADFRRWITVLAVLALFAGLASAQVGGGSGTSSTSLVCSSEIGAVTPQLRSEGFTELVGDIVIKCTGGTAVAIGTQVPRTNVVVSLPATVTSRILGATDNRSEAMLLIDEPGSGLGGPVPGYGPNASQVPCQDPTGQPLGSSPNCVVTARSVTVGSDTYAVAQYNSGTTDSPVWNVGYNTFQGLVNANQVTFYGVPVLPPVTSGVSRVYRIVNVRINASTLAPSGLVGTAGVTATISTNGTASLPLTNSQLVVGYVQPGLTTSVQSSKLSTASAGAFRQCSSVLTSTATGFDAAAARAGVLRFRELFGTAFRTRVAPLTDTAYAGQARNLTGQNIPGAVGVASTVYSFFNSESGFIASYYTNTSGGVASYAGLADYGTRLKAVFTNVPAGVRIYVATSNLAVPATVGGQSVSSYAQLVTSETANDGSGSVPLVSGATLTYGTYSAVEVTLDSNRSGSAVWEVLNANPNGIDTIEVPVYISYTSNTASNSPAAGIGLVNLSYAPTPAIAFTAADGSNPSRILPVPRFTDNSTAANLFQIVICQTAILYPYVVNQSGFDTGIAIANTSKDPFGTSNQSGTCTLYFYGKNETGGLVATSVPANGGTAIDAGTVWASNLQTLSAGVQGYAIAVCNFQYAHGYAAITDLGVTRILSSYLALIMNSGTIYRITEGEALNQ
jgi:hypothetical protein